MVVENTIDPLMKNIITLVFLGGFAITFALPKFPRHIIHSIFLLGIGGLPILNGFGIVEFALPELPIISYVITIVIMLTGKTLFIDGWKEHSSLGHTCIGFGIVIVASVLIPTLYQINAITFNIPSYPPIVNSVLYLISGVLLLISTFMLQE